MFCNQCGHKNIDNAKFCSSCGNKLVSDIETPPPIQTQKEIPSLRKKQIELWNPNAAANWSLLFTPIFGSYLQMKNWNELGITKEAEKAKYWLLATVFFIFLINFGATWSDADPEQFANRFRGLGLLYIIVWYFAYARKQPKYVKEKLNDQYQKKSWLIPLVSATIIIFIVTFLFMLIPNNSYQQVPNQPAEEQQTQKIGQIDRLIDDYNKNNVQQEQTNQTQAELKKEHYDAIFSAHPDAESIVQSQEFRNWVYNQSTEWKNYYINVANEGSSTQVIEMLNDYKKGINH